MIDWNLKIRVWLERQHSTMTYRSGIPKVEPVGLLFFELYTMTGFSRGNPQRIDAFHLSDVPSKNYARTAYEIKVSKRDFLGEVAQPNKRRAALMFSNQFYFLTPKGLVDRAMVPIECGLIEVDEDVKSVTVIKAPWRDTSPPTWALATSMARHLARNK